MLKIIGLNILILMTLMGCGGGSSTPPAEQSNTKPVANAGQNTSIDEQSTS